MKSILLIIPYFGQWPLWFDAHLKSIEKNPTINWLCPTDCVVPNRYPENIKFLKTSLEEFNQKINNKVKVDVPLAGRKFCDLKIAYGDVFAEEVAEYDFWGICDMDIIWGDIRKFMTEDLLMTYDVISSRKNAISGHFNIFKNDKKLNELYKKLPHYKTLFSSEKLYRTDEVTLTDFIKESEVFKREDLKVYWNKILCNQERGRDSHQEYYLDRWLWDNGKMLNTQTGEEVMYLHFINWKKKMHFSQINFSDAQSFFYISFNGIHYKKNSKLKKKIQFFLNSFMGYYIKEKRRLRIKKLKKIKHRIQRKILKNVSIYTY
ncbi:DUF6625 family protein [Haloflavibacter putidus]|uniref:Uncharacterized protein n=1 Tax=Haloflavibacter putidus TaxID=2576776 RepID=A0A507ZJA9_9FLAO|nr:DUF6625 family protein [Haloflavibacter putidus]TQD33812.1 hypothetical protein FKR84_12700 [Haloflavibacter putidus]